MAGIFRLTAEKQPLLFVQILRMVLERLPEAHAIHVGTGPMEMEFREALAGTGIADRVHLLGRREDIPVLLAASTATLLSSLVEGTPNVLIEAQHFGCPVVTTRAGGAQECLEHGHTGYAHDLEDVSGMVESLCRLLSEPDLRQSYSSKAHIFARQRFGTTRMVGETIQFYHDIFLARPR